MTSYCWYSDTVMGTEQPSQVQMKYQSWIVSAVGIHERTSATTYCKNDLKYFYIASFYFICIVLQHGIHVDAIRVFFKLNLTMNAGKSVCHRQYLAVCWVSVLFEAILFGFTMDIKWFLYRNLGTMILIVIYEEINTSQLSKAAPCQMTWIHNIVIAHIATMETVLQDAL